MPRSQVEKTCPALELRQAAVSLHEGFLGQVVGQRVIPPHEMAQKVPHGGLVPADQFSECGVVVRDDHAGDQLRVGHVRAGWRAGCRGGGRKR